MNEKELEEMEKRCEATKAARQTLEADNEKLDLELMDAKAQLAKIQEGKDNFEAKLSEVIGHQEAIDGRRYPCPAHQYYNDNFEVAWAGMMSCRIQGKSVRTM